MFAFSWVPASSLRGLLMTETDRQSRRPLGSPTRGTCSPRHLAMRPRKEKRGWGREERRPAVAAHLAGGSPLTAGGRAGAGVPPGGDAHPERLGPLPPNGLSGPETGVGFRCELLGGQRPLVPRRLTADVRPSPSTVPGSVPRLAGSGAFSGRQSFGSASLREPEARTAVLPVVTSQCLWLNKMLVPNEGLRGAQAQAHS